MIREIEDSCISRRFAVDTRSDGWLPACPREASVGHARVDVSVSADGRERNASSESFKLLAMLSALLSEEKRDTALLRAEMRRHAEIKRAATVHNELVPLPSDEEQSAQELPPRHSSPEKNRLELLSRREVFQRWPAQRCMSAAELNRLELFSRSVETKDFDVDVDDEGEPVMLRRAIYEPSPLGRTEPISAYVRENPRGVRPGIRVAASEGDLSALSVAPDPLAFGEDVALMLIDIQPVYWSKAPEIMEAFPEFESNVKRVLECARNAGSKIVHVRASYTYEKCPWLENFERLNPGRRAYEIDPNETEPFAAPLEGETVVDKDTFGAFIHAPDLAPMLRAAGVKTIVVAGLITSVCVQHSVFGAFNAGFRVVVVEDACGDRSRRRHEAALMLYGQYMYDICKTSELVSQTAHTADSHVETLGETLGAMALKKSDKVARESSPISTLCIPSSQVSL